MVEIKTKICDRCDTEFDIDEAYYNLSMKEHPHPEDMVGNNTPDERSWVLCGPCSAKLPVWLEPDVDSFEELHDESVEELFAGSTTEE